MAVVSPPTDRQVGPSQPPALASLLALHGGAPVVDGRLGVQWPVRDETEKTLLAEVVDSGKWWRGAYGEGESSKVGAFETAFARLHDAQFGIAVTNGTTALECAYKTVGVEAGDEVIVPAITFVATATAALQIGAVPVFVDVDPRTYTIDPAAVEAAVTPRTRCIAPVDYGGMPCDYDALIDIGRRRSLPIVADCAHAHGSQWKGVGVGALTELGTFSFQAGKTLTTGEGGMILTNRADLAEKAYSYHHIGRLRGRPFYEHHLPASNLRMTEWQGAVGLAQLSRFSEQTAIRERNALRLAAGLQRLHDAGVGVAPLSRDPRVSRWSYYLWHFRFLAEKWEGVTRDSFLKALKAEGVPCGTGHTQPLYKNP
ncbi:MAG TPA: DegT/DnrJ/EryC1/StrS family aminotransferase, partial [Chloroflexota bacterium]|nr:DegT/DnrJ/EryC1/StrS family aminotransferase [Chloroflexota bacterium]